MTGVRWRPVLVVAVTLTILVGLGAVVAYLLAGSPRDQDHRSQLWSAILAALALGVSVALLGIERGLRPLRPGAGAVTADQAARGAEYLAARGATYWRGRARQQGLTSTAPVAVRWGIDPGDPTLDLRLAQKSVLPMLHGWDGWQQEPGGSGRVSAVTVLSGGVVTTWYEDLYAHLGGGDALVVLGAPGSGKSGSLLLLLLEVLEQRARSPLDRRSLVRVPVWVTCGSWDPLESTLQEHAAAVLARDYPDLTSPVFGGAGGPEALLTHGLVAVFLDGLDEMPPALQPAALTAIGQANWVPVILTSRTQEFRAALTTGGLEYPVGVIRLVPVSPDAAADFLQGPRQTPAHAAAWGRIVTHLREKPDSALSQVMSTPLGLSLARDTYKESDPAGLLLTAHTDPETVLTTLMTAYLNHSYPVSPKPRERRRTESARWGLSWIARNMETHGMDSSGATRDLSWWDIPAWYEPAPSPCHRSRWQNIFWGIGALMGGLAGGWVGNLHAGRIGSDRVTVLTGVIVGGWISGWLASDHYNWRAITPWKRQRRILTWAGRLVGGLAGGAVGLLTSGTRSALIGVLIGGAVGGLQARVEKTPQMLKPRLPSVVEISWSMMVVMFSGLVGVWTGGPWCGLAVGIVVFPAEVFGWWVAATQTSGAMTPLRAYRSDRRNALFTVAVLVASGGLVGWLGDLLIARWHLVLLVAFGWLLAFVAVLLAIGAVVWWFDLESRFEQMRVKPELSELLKVNSLSEFGAFWSIYRAAPNGMLPVVALFIANLVASLALIGSVVLALGGGVLAGSAGGMAAGLIRSELTVGPAVGIFFVEMRLLVRYHRRIRIIPLLEAALNLHVLRQAGSVYQFRHGALQKYLAQTELHRKRRRH